MNKKEMRLRRLVQKLNDGLEKHSAELEKRFRTSVSIKFDVNNQNELICKTSGMINVIHLTERDVIEYLDDLSNDLYYYNLALDLSEAA